MLNEDGLHESKRAIRRRASCVRSEWNDMREGRSCQGKVLTKSRELIEINIRGKPGGAAAKDTL